MFGLIGPIAARAATTPSLGSAASYGVLASTYTNTAAGTTINGDVGFTTGPAVVPLGTHTNYGSGAPYTEAGTDQGAALAALALEPCTFPFGSGAIDLSTDTTHGTAGVYTPGVYCSSGAMDVGGPLTLSGSGTYIFRTEGALTSTAGAIVTLAGASACDVFWTPTSATTLAANTTFAGTVISDAGITIGANTTWEGQSLAFGGTITTDTDTITVPTCASAPATLHVVKTVINDNGGLAVASDFTLNVTGTNVSSSSFVGSEAGVDVTLDAGAYAVTETSLSGYLQSGSGDCSGTIAAGETKTCTITNNDIAPQLIVIKTIINDNNGTITDFPLFIDGFSVISGVASTTSIGLHTVSETADSGYTAVIGGHCAADGTITLALGDLKTCTIINDDIASVVVPPPSAGGSVTPFYASVPPLIDVVKVPSPLALPAGPGTVTYTYTLRNIGTVPVTDITMVGDTCSPIILASGDINADAKLDVNETWTYRCSTMLSATHTNTVTATGWANGISAVDIASATVIVGVPVVPPLIHLIKKPSVFALAAPGGAVTYTYTVTNAGTAPLSDVSITDDKCTGLPGRVLGHPGDVNKNDLLESNEIWSFTCQSNLAKTTTNTGTAEGRANGLIAKDFAIATVVVAAPDQALPEAAAPVVPGLPNAGLAPLEKSLAWSIIMPIIALALVLASLIVVIKKRII
ncbi:MAG: ice-binding family protein [bacterium]|nr:ice-binding family protein [bacterium]